MNAIYSNKMPNATALVPLLCPVEEVRANNNNEYVGTSSARCHHFSHNECIAQIILRLIHLHILAQARIQTRYSFQLARG